MDGLDPTDFMADAPVGSVVYGFAGEGEGESLQVEMLIRERSGVIGAMGKRPELQLRAGCFPRGRIPVVVVLLRFGERLPVYASFWNYHHPDQHGDGNIFHHMAGGGDELLVKFFGDSGKIEQLFGVRHPLGGFFQRVAASLGETEPWSEAEFRQSVQTLLDEYGNNASLWRAVAEGDGE